jgi:lipopolysaccharide transport system ATP-binding protein
MAYLAAVDVSVEFPLYHSDSRSLKKMLLGRASGRFAQDGRHRPVVQALLGISLSLKSGDRLGLIGVNGSGKTTLLRTMSGIYQPRHGHILIDGRLTSLLDPAEGMNMELTGRENIRLRGLFHGLSRTEIARLEADVEDFSELGQFLELPVRSYSTGMMVRLAFAMATAVRPEILLMDEWIMAGDARFMAKAKARIEAMVSAADILVLASHSPAILAEWCTRLMWLDQGKIRADGTPLEVLGMYLPAPQFAEMRPMLEQGPTRTALG